jgi:hypothetical protein
MTIDSNNLVWSMLSGTGGGNPAVATSTHAISTSFADTNTDWSVNTANGIYNDVLKQASLLRLNGSGNMLQIVDDLIAGNPGVKARTWTNSWSTYTTVYSGANASRTNWGSVRVADSNTYVLGQSNTSAWTFSQTTNGTSWNSKTAPSFPTGGLATNSGVALSTDGTFVWACVIRGDANTTVSCNKYTPGSDTWGGWSDVTNTAATRAYVTTPSNLGNGGLPAMWTQTNGGNFEIHIATFVNTGVQFR